MIINIDNTYQIESDRFNWIVQKRLKTPQINKRTGEDIFWSNIAYCQNLESSIRFLAELKIRLINSSDVIKIQRKIEQIGIKLTKALKPYGLTISKKE